MRPVIAIGLLGPILLFGAPPIPQIVAQTAQTAPTSAALKVEELDQLLAPIALYPDELLAQVLTAATYPLEIVMASRWIAEPSNAKLKGDALVKALQSQSWDASVKSIVPFPAVLKMLSDRLDWTRKLGDAFLAQPKDCLASVQRLRQRAMAAGKLTSSPQQKVTSEGQTIIIQPADPQVVYVPAYNPAVVYGAWPYPAYPPYYYPPPPGYAFATGMAIGFAVGIAVNNNYWGWGHPNWVTGDININVNRWNQINGNRTNIAGNNWRHDAVHRDGVAYRDAATRQQFGGQRSGAEARRNFRGYDGQAARPSTQPARTGSQVKPPARSAGPSTLPAQRPGGMASRPTPTAFAPDRGAFARADSARGQFSRQQMGNFSGGRQFGGGAGRAGRGGGSRSGGGFRR